jgi:NitT/TauT family transport system substrate-binding protein
MARAWQKSPQIGLAVLLALGFGPARAADKLTVRLDWITDAMHMPIFLAAERGWFKAAGLDMDIEDGNGSVTTVQLVGNGNFDLGLADLSPMTVARDKGVSITSVAGIIRKGGMGFIVPKSSGITHIEDLKGKQIIYTAGSLEGPFVLPFLRAHGIAADQVSLLNVQAASKVSLYLAGRGDAVISTVPAAVTAAIGHRDSIGILFWDNGFHVPGFGLVARPDKLATKADAVRRFVSIICGGWGYVLASPDHMREAAQAVRHSRPTTPLTEQMLLDQTEAYRGYFTTDATRDLPLCMQSETDWTATLETMRQAGVIGPDAKPSDEFTNAYIDPAMIRRITAGE